MATLDVSGTSREFADTVRRVASEGERVVVRSGGKEVAALVPLEDLALIQELEDRLDLDEARRRLAEAGPNVPWEQIKAEIGL